MGFDVEELATGAAGSFFIEPAIDENLSSSRRLAPEQCRRPRSDRHGGQNRSTLGIGSIGRLAQNPFRRGLAHGLHSAWQSQYDGFNARYTLWRGNSTQQPGSWLISPKPPAADLTAARCEAERLGRHRQ